MRVSVVLGTRPEIIKMTSIIKTLRSKKIQFEIVHTGQHYDKNLSDIFFKELNLQEPDYFLGVGSGTQAEQTATALVKLEKTFIKTNPDIVLVEGDTNTVLAGALAATKLGINVGHVEAGLRSYDIRMPEEYNRRLTDHISALLFAPTVFNAKTLKGENVWGKIFVTGNTVIDACLEYMPIAKKKSKILSKIRFNEFALATAHRAENVDNQKVLTNFVRIFTECTLPVVYPIHPRTIKRLKEFGLYRKLANNKNVQLLDPVGYFDFLLLMKYCSFILTDSGGIQEEASAPNIRKKVFILRRSTERPEAIKAGCAEVVGTKYVKAMKSIKRFIKNPVIPKSKSPFGDGKSGKRIVEIIEKSCYKPKTVFSI